MSSIRQNKLGSLFQKELGEIFQQETKSLFGGAFITVTQVQVTRDLGLAKVYLSIMNEKKEEVLEMIQMNTPNLRNLLGRRIRNQVRRIPELAFYLDDSLDYVQHIEDLLGEWKEYIGTLLTLYHVHYLSGLAMCFAFLHQFYTEATRLSALFASTASENF